MIMTIEQIEEAIDRHEVRRRDFWQEAAGGDRVPLTQIETMRIIEELESVAEKAHCDESCIGCSGDSYPCEECGYCSRQCRCDLADENAE